MSNDSVKLTGVVYRSTIKPPKMDEDGFFDSQDLEVVLRVPMGDGVRQKLADLSRLQKGRSAHITIASVEPELPLSGNQE